MGSSLGRQRAEQRENQQSAGDRRPRAKSTVLPASAPYSVLPLSRLCQALPGKGPQGDGPPAVPPTPRRDAVWAGCRAGPGRGGSGFIPYVEHAVRRCLWADLGNGWLLHHCKLVQAYASGQLLWGFLLLSVHLGLGVFFWESRCMEMMPLRCGADCTWHSRREASLLFVVMPNCLGSEIHLFLRCGNLKGCERLALGLTGWWDCS